MVVMLVVGGVQQRMKKKGVGDAPRSPPTCRRPLSTLLVLALPIRRRRGRRCCCHCCRFIDGGGGTGLGVVAVG